MEEDESEGVAALTDSSAAHSHVVNSALILLMSQLVVWGTELTRLNSALIFLVSLFFVWGAELSRFNSGLDSWSTSNRSTSNQRNVTTRKLTHSISYNWNGDFGRWYDLSEKILDKLKQKNALIDCAPIDFVPNDSAPTYFAHDILCSNSPHCHPAFYPPVLQMKE